MKIYKSEQRHTIGKGVKMKIQKLYDSTSYIILCRIVQKKEYGAKMYTQKLNDMSEIFV